MKEYIEREAFIGAKRKQYCADCDRRKGMKNGEMRFCYCRIEALGLELLDRIWTRERHHPLDATAGAAEGGDMMSEHIFAAVTLLIGFFLGFLSGRSGT